METLPLDPPPVSMEAGSSKFRHCLICGVQTANTHMGIDSCRACAVFYKRTLTGTRPLKCKSGSGACLLNDPTTSCRKCRFERFQGTMDRAYGASRRPAQQPMSDMREEEEVMSEESVVIDEPEEEMDVKPIIHPPSTSYIDHNSYFTIESSSGLPLLERIRRGYSAFCLMRRMGEACLGGNTKGVVCRDRCFERQELHFTRATYSNSLKFGRVYIESILDFAHATFDDFRLLQDDEKKIVMRSCFNLVGTVSGSYRAAHHFPHDETTFISYTTTINYESAADFFDECPTEMNKEAAVRSLRENLMKGHRMKKSGFLRVRPSEDELLALIGLAFWSTDHPELDVSCDGLARLAAKNRAQIMREMHQSYWRAGRTDYATRIGELFCLLVTLQKSVSMMNEEIQLYRLLDVFDDKVFKKCECGTEHGDKCP